MSRRRRERAAGRRGGAEPAFENASERAIDVEEAEHERWLRETGYRQLGELLYWCWDPMGLSPTTYPWNEGEYNTYARELIAMLRDGIDARGVADYLLEAEIRWIGASEEPSSSLALGEQIVLWYRSSIQVWLEFGTRDPYRLD